MENTSNRKAKIENILQNEYQKKGFLVEDDIIDICIEHDLDLVEIDNICDRLLNKKMIVRDNDDKISKIEDTEDSFVDRSHLDYDRLLKEIKRDYPNCACLIDEILQILPPQSKEWQSIIGEAQNGNAYARERIILMYLRTVMKLAYNYSNFNYCDFEDAFQDGVLGLIKAIDKFDITSPDKFSAYFSLWVMQSMQRYGVIKGTIMHYPVHYKERLITIVNKACEIMRDDCFEEAVEWVNDDLFNGRYLINGIAKAHVLPYIPIPQEVEMDNVFSDLLQGSLKVTLKEMMSILRDKEKKVLELRYGLKDGIERTLEEVGAIFNVTRERVRQIEAKALEKLRNSKDLDNLKDYL